MSRCMSWDERVLDAMARAKELSCEHFDAVCTTAAQLFQPTKQSKKRLSRTASACGWDHQTMEATVLALAKILMDAATTELSEPQFRASMAALDVPPDHINAFTQLYVTHAGGIKTSVSREVRSSIPQFYQFDWRIDLEIATRAVRNAPRPIVTLRLETRVPNRASFGGATDDEAMQPTQQHTTCVRVDYANLRNVQRQLEDALREVDSTHASRIQRYLR